MTFEILLFAAATKAAAGTAPIIILKQQSDHVAWYLDPAVHVAVATWIIAAATAIAGGFGAVAARSAAASLRLEAEPAIVVSKEANKRIVPAAGYRVTGSDAAGFQLDPIIFDTEFGFQAPNEPYLMLSFMNTGRSPCVNFETNVAVQALPHGAIPYVIAERPIRIRLINPHYNQAIIIVNGTEPLLSPMHVVLFQNATRTNAQDKTVPAPIYASSFMFKMPESQE